MPTGPVPHRICSICGKSKPLRSHFCIHKLGKGGFTAHCRKCQAVLNDKAKDDPRVRMHTSSKINAHCKGLEHTISKNDIVLPEICPYLGIRIDYRRAKERGRLRSFDAPSIDRIDPTRGYVPGNVQVISDLANRMKSDATVEQLLAFAEGVLRRHG